MLLKHFKTTSTLFAIVLAIGLTSLSPSTSKAQTADYLRDAEMQQLLRRMDLMQRELDYLRDAKPVVSQASTTGINVQPVNFTAAGGCSSCDLSGACGCGGQSGCNCGSGNAPCVDCPRVTTLSPYFNINVYGALRLDMLLSDARAVAPGTPYFLLPDSIAGFDQDTSDFHARQSSLGAMFSGPQIGSFKSGGNLLVYFYNDNAFADAYGILPLQAYGDLTNDNWRMAAGLQFDVFNPGAPTVLPFSVLLGSGNSGNAARGQIRLERFVYPGPNSQLKIQTALSEPITSLFDPSFRIAEDNGWPNFEARIALALGAPQGSGPTAIRPIEFGVSGVVGQFRNTVLDNNSLAIQRFVADVWGLGADLRWRINESFGAIAEFYTGEGLGTYNGAALQLFDPDRNFEGVRSTGGFGEFYVYWTPRLHSHFGYGIDDPVDADVPFTASLLGRTQNSTAYGNVLFDVTPNFRMALEISRRDTRFRNPLVPDNDGTFMHSQIAWIF